MLNKKSGKVGRSAKNPHKHWVFAGQNRKNFWPKTHFFGHFRTFFHKRPNHFEKVPKKSGQKLIDFLKPFSEFVKNALKNRPFFELSELVFFAENVKFCPDLYQKYN